MSLRSADLARRLVEAGRSERPPAALEQRLLCLDPERAARPRPVPAKRAGGSRELGVERTARLRPPVASWARTPFAAALLAAGIVGLAVAWGLASARAPLISAERRPRAAADPPGTSPSAKGASHLEPPRAAVSPAQRSPARAARAGAEPSPSSSPASAAAPAGRPDRATPAPSASPAAASPASRPSSSGRSSPTRPSSPAAARARPPASMPAPAAPSAVGGDSAAAEHSALVPRTASTPAASDTLATELALLNEARAALRSGDGARALAWLDRYDRRRQSPALDAEAALLRIESMSRLGRRERAAELAERFVREHPHDALADRARRFISKAGAAPPR